jgi:hypothetical protein
MVNKGLKPVTRMNALWSHRGRRAAEQSDEVARWHAVASSAFTVATTDYSVPTA